MAKLFPIKLFVTSIPLNLYPVSLIKHTEHVLFEECICKTLSDPFTTVTIKHVDNPQDDSATDILDAYLQTPSSKKRYIICDPDFGHEHQLERSIIGRACYGEKAGGKDFWHHS
jgi:hypothetical protein